MQPQVEIVDKSIHSFIHLLTHSVIQQILIEIYPISGTVLGTGDSEVNQEEWPLTSWNLCSGGGQKE